MDYKNSVNRFRTSENRTSVFRNIDRLPLIRFSRTVKYFYSNYDCILKQIKLFFADFWDIFYWKSYQIFILSLCDQMVLLLQQIDNYAGHMSHHFDLVEYQIFLPGLIRYLCCYRQMIFMPAVTHHIFLPPFYRHIIIPSIDDQIFLQRCP
jgi:hypothetical protein